MKNPEEIQTVLKTLFKTQINNQVGLLLFTNTTVTISKESDYQERDTQKTTNWETVLCNNSVFRLLAGTKIGKKIKSIEISQIEKFEDKNKKS